MTVLGSIWTAGWFRTTPWGALLSYSSQFADEEGEVQYLSNLSRIIAGEEHG